MNRLVLDEKVKNIDAIIDRFLPAEEGLAKTVMSAMNYSIHVGGKRLRPMFMMEAYEMFNGIHPEEELYPFMAAIEMIHTYSLCHDDLPAMDNDDMRRGMPSTHAKFGEAMGILAGDALLNYAFEVAMKAFDPISENDPDEAGRIIRVSKALKILAKKAGISGMIAGQVVDIESEGSQDITMDTIMYIHENKTAAMIESSMMIGAALAGANDEEITAMEKIGSDVGLAFQIVDDILDITGDADALGKPTGSDERNGKITYVTLVGLDQAAEDVKKLSKRAEDTLASLPQSSSEPGVFLKDLIASLTNRDR